MNTITDNLQTNQTTAKNTPPKDLQQKVRNMLKWHEKVMQRVRVCACACVHVCVCTNTCVCADSMLPFTPDVVCGLQRCVQYSDERILNTCIDSVAIIVIINYSIV